MFNIHKDLKVTDKLHEQIAMGKDIAEMYDAGMINFILSYFDRVKNWDDQYSISKQDMLYKSIYDYWVYGFRPDQQIYYELLNKSHDEKKAYISLQEEIIYYTHLNRKSDITSFEDKYESYKLLEPYYKREVVKISGEKDFPVFEDFISRHPSFVVKPTGLHDTYGIRKVDTEGCNDIKALFNSLINVGEKFVDDFSTGDYIHTGAVLEEIIEQDSRFGVFSPKSLSVIRIPTFRVNGKVHLHHAYTKIGSSDELIVGETRMAYMCGVDVNTGELTTPGITEEGLVFEKHQVSNIQFKGFKFPEWDKLVMMLKELGEQLIPTVNYIGWDVVLTPKGWVVVEGNFYGQALWQSPYRRGMKKELEELLGWHIDDNKYWWQYKSKQIQKEAGLI